MDPEEVEFASMSEANDSNVSRARRWFGSRVTRLWHKSPNNGAISNTDDFKALLGDESTTSKYKKAGAPAGHLKVCYEN